MAETFKHSFRATELDARDGMEFIVARLRQTGATEDWTGTVQIALAEAVNNIVEHAYVDMPRGNIEIACEMKETGLTMRITDSGSAFGTDELPPGNPVDLNVGFGDLPEGGFGWFLLRTLTQSISYDRKGDNNILTLAFDAEAS
ncbi:ATP-binding protein [Aliisedimentitalea scapharcae]|uniref:ATP-binding protein n=1 Tax=Aliisedimentitalea scapharcae TaxID=1524259 RepID=A0ABZ2XRT2_9RHOB|nr:ATP-binding protein [Rhodobacteraceae bacterium M382]